MKIFLTSIDVLELYFYFGVKKKKEKKKDLTFHGMKSLFVKLM